MADNDDFVCKNCGAHLPVVHDRKVIDCEYCGTQNPVPQEMGQSQQPQPQPYDELRFQPQGQATVDADSARDMAEAVADVARNQISAEVSHAKSSIAHRLIGCVISIVVFVVIATIGIGSIFPLCSRGTSGSAGVLGKTKKNPGEDLVTPGWANADGLETMKNVERHLKAEWKPAVKCETIRFSKVRADGTQDLSGSEGSITTSCYDTSVFDSIVPGQTEVEDAHYMVNMSSKRFNGMATDLHVHHLEDMVLLETWPACDLATVRKKAAEVGWPEDGYAEIAWPALPWDLRKDRIDTELSFVRKDGKKLKKVLEGMEWDTSRYMYYEYYVPNLKDQHELPKYFDPETCEPVDVDALVAEAIDEIRAQCPDCKKKKKGK